jgi:hypothetical protein
MGLLQILSEWPGAVFLRRVPIAYLLVNAAHIISIGLVIGAVVTLDLRMLGLFKNHQISVLSPPLSRVAAAGLGLAILTGLMLFSVRPSAYIQNTAFLVKVGLVSLGIVNALLLNRRWTWRAGFPDGAVSAGMQVSALLSLTFWIGAVVAGRWIGFL